MLEMLWSSPSRAEMARKKKAKATQAAFEAFRAAHDDIPFEDDLPFLRASARQIVQHIDQMEPGWSPCAVIRRSHSHAWR
jgi:hypothetical protein